MYDIVMISNYMLRLRVRKLEQWEAILVDRTDHLSVPYQTSEILRLTIGAVMNVPRWGVVCVLNLL